MATRKRPELATPGVHDRLAGAITRKCTRHPAEREALQRIHAARVVLAAIESGEWPCEVELIDATGALLADASRWAMVAELETVP